MKRIVAGLALIFSLAVILCGCAAKCADEGCDNKVIQDSLYCSTHTCASPDCFNHCVDGGSYCEEHTCQVEGCYNPATDSTGYCDEHIRPSAESTADVLESNMVVNYIGVSWLKAISETFVNYDLEILGTTATTMEVAVSGTYYQFPKISDICSSGSITLLIDVENNTVKVTDDPHNIFASLENYCYQCLS